jgi:KUP system potassium uptake protein
VPTNAARGADLDLASEAVPIEGHASQTVHGHSKANVLGLGLAALGVVFGDIGTSPLYTLKTVIGLAGGKLDADTMLGMLSLVFWTLTIITTVKYVVVAMSIDNDGEGGIVALMSLVGIKHPRPFIVAVGLFGAALIYGDGAITPAISVLSALEGLNMATPAVEPYVLPASVVVLIALFAAQPLGTERIGKAFGPIMALWFFALAVLGIGGISHHPGVLAAINPWYGARFLAAGGGTAFLVLGAVFLCVTGAEALYADMGHFGPAPIRLAWLGLVFPSLLLNYAGQAAIVLDGGPTDGNIFYRLCPGWLLVPMVGLAALATIIASQAIITGAYSMTRQAIQLGWLPRLAVKQTSSEGYGQIYVGFVNWLLMIVTVLLAFAFRKSDNLASAYGMAVSLTMLMTSVLLFIAMREVWKWSMAASGALSLFFLIIDTAFFSANLVKIFDGGYVPLLLATAVYAVMWLWHRGSRAVQVRLGEELVPIEALQERIVAEKIPRVPGTAVFLTRTDRDVPPVLLWHVAHNRALHRNVILLTVKGAPVPWIDADKRLVVTPIAPDMWRAQATFGFMEHPDVPAIVRRTARFGCGADMRDLTFYVGHISVMARNDGHGLPWWNVASYAAMERNSVHVADVMRLPLDKTVELGRHVAI